METNNTQLIAEMLRQSIAEGKRPFLTIISSSMAPLLQIGDQVGLEPIASGQLQIGDIITLEQDAHLLTHRFWGWDDDGRLQTRGDRPFTPDAPGKADQILGRVIVRRRHNQELSLQIGIGRRMNQHLTWLVQVESYLLTGHASSLTAPPMLPNKQRTLLIRLVRRAFYTWANLTVNILAQLTK